jgi:hypothetical protein
LNRLTDTSQYTGSHKHRFDDNGNGRGIAGRDQPSLTKDLSQITNREATTTITGVNASAAIRADLNSAAYSLATLKKSDSNKNVSNLSKPALNGSSSNLNKPSLTSSVNKSSSNLVKSSLNGSTSSLQQKSNYSFSSSNAASKPKSDIFSRLTDSSQYTGTHKHRFDDNGNGRGLAGRDQAILTKDLSQITNREASTNIRGVNASAMAVANAGFTPAYSQKRAHDLIKSRDSLVSVKK